MAISWTYDRKNRQYVTQVANLPFHMVVYEQEGQKNTVVVTCRSEHAAKTGNLTFANSVLSAKIQAEELIETGRWVEFTPEYMTQPVQPKIIAKRVKPKPVEQKKKIEPVANEQLQKLVDRFRKDY
jgi:glutamine amidotransferase-like uncharacterized protein